MKTFRRFAVMIAAAFGAIFAVDLSPINPPPMNPIVRWNENPFAKRLVMSILSGSQMARSILRTVLNAPNAFLRVTGFSGAGMALNRGVINTFLEPLPVFDFQAARDKADLPRALYIEEIMCTISGQLDVVDPGAGADGTLQTEPIARLIDEISIKWDGFNLVGPISARDLAALSRRLVSQALTSDDITIPGVQSTAFRQSFVIPFNRRYLADPFDTVLPPLDVKSELVMEVRWNQDRSNSLAATTAGSGAIVSGGTMETTLSDVRMTAVPRVARDGKMPWAIPVISSYETRQFSAADPRLPLDMRSPLPFDAVLLRTLEDAAEDAADLIVDTTFKSSQVRILNQVDANTLRAYEEAYFPGVQAASEVGSNMILFADGGKLGNAVNPAELSNPMFEFDVSTPNNNPGFIRAVVMELLSIPDVTRH